MKKTKRVADALQGMTDAGTFRLETAFPYVQASGLPLILMEPLLGGRLARLNGKALAGKTTKGKHSRRPFPGVSPPKLFLKALQKFCGGL